MCGRHRRRPGCADDGRRAVTEPLPVFRHVVLTRFNTRRPGHTDRPGEAWLQDRWRLFEEFCIRSIARQTVKEFDWLVFFDSDTPQSWRSRVDATAATAGFRPVFLAEPFTGTAAAAAIAAAGLDDAPFLITSRLDNDDAIAPDFIGTVQRAFRPHRLQFINLPFGYQLAGRQIYLRPYLASSFASLVEQVDAGPVRTVHFVDHHLIGRHSVRQIWSPPAWLQVVHDRNLANDIRGIPASGRAASELFGLDRVELAHPPIVDRAVALAGVARRGLSSADARARARSVLGRRAASMGRARPTPSTVDAPTAADGPMRVTAILTCYNRRDLTLRLLTGWFAQRDHSAHLDAVVVDDGSTDGTGEAVRRHFPRVRVLRADGALFWAGGMAAAEAAARRSDPDALLWLNDDVELTPHCLRDLLAVSAGCMPPAAVAGALTDPITAEPTYGAVRTSRWHPMRTRPLAASGTPRRVAAVHGNVFLVPRTAYQAAEGIDGGFVHAYADFDYGLRLRRLGYPVLLSPQPVGHCSRTTSSRLSSPPDLSLVTQLRRLNSPHGLPLSSQVRYLRRHAGPWWPALTLAPYVKLVVRSVLGRRSVRS